MSTREKGGFTLPGEAGYEELSFALAEKWGADAIRDSDGTKLNDSLYQSDFEIYSTLCIIRGHNAFAKQHPDYLQQCFLQTEGTLALNEDALEIPLLEGFSEEQFALNASEAAFKYWQVWDRTENRLLEPSEWRFDPEKKTVIIEAPLAFRRYTVSFMAYRIWEEISMYNHVTNALDKEHLMPLDPAYEAVQAYMLEWLEKWCEEHPETDVVRFTSLFYNFVWIWGSEEARRDLYVDWGAYDFSVSAKMLDDFAETRGYPLTAEDFINQGKYKSTHMPPDQKKRDYMAFVCDFVADFGAKLVEIVHRHGKKAYVFYDDSWIGLEPYGPRFSDMHFDGIIKCLFSAYEARMCAAVPVKTHELRLHPYLFPTGLGGAPSFAPGGDPLAEARKYWLNIRRALLRVKIDRIGMGGYLHLTEDYPEFTDYIAQLADEFREIKALHEAAEVYTAKVKVLVLHAWGSKRPWTLCGHWHESNEHVLIHVIEALAGFPVQVDFADFSEIKALRPEEYDVLINGGKAGTAWSGGAAWSDPDLISRISEWTYNGGLLIGFGEPSALEGYQHYFRLASVFGVDKDTGARSNHGKWPLPEASGSRFVQQSSADFALQDGLYLTDPEAEVLSAKEGAPLIVRRRFGKGQALYFSDFIYSSETAQMLLEMIADFAGDKILLYTAEDPALDCAFFPALGKMIAVNSSAEKRSSKIRLKNGVREITLDAYQQLIFDLKEEE